MTCIHGLDERNCPTCRILKSTKPINTIKAKNVGLPELGNPLFKKNSELKNEIVKDLVNKRLNLTINPPNTIPKPTLITEIPNFENKLFFERVKDLDISKEDTFGISKKIPLKNPEWHFEEED